MGGVTVPPQLGVWQCKDNKNVWFLAESDSGGLDHSLAIYCFDDPTSPKRGVVLIRTSDDSTAFQRLLTLKATGPESWDQPRCDIRVRYFKHDLPHVAADSITSLLASTTNMDMQTPVEGEKFGLEWRSDACSSVWKETAGETIQYRTIHEWLWDETTNRRIARFSHFWSRPKKSKFGVEMLSVDKKAPVRWVEGYDFLMHPFHVVPSLAKACLSRLYTVRFWGMAISEFGSQPKRDKENSWGDYIE